MSIRRNSILEDSVEQVENFLEQCEKIRPNAKFSRISFKITFAGEPGVDGGWTIDLI